MYLVKLAPHCIYQIRYNIIISNVYYSLYNYYVDQIYNHIIIIFDKYTKIGTYIYLAIIIYVIV